MTPRQAEHYFTTINGRQWRCEYPEGQDPLLAAWRSGVRDAHPNWTNASFWRNPMSVERRAAQRDIKRASEQRRRDRRKGS